MFEDVRQAFRELLNGNVAPEDRRAMLVEMRETLVRAKLALDDLRNGVAATQKKLTAERNELETIRRRRALAERIQDTETVEVAIRFETLQGERLALLERRLEVETSELAMVEREVAEMTAQYKAAGAGVGSGLRPGGAGTAPVTDAELGLGERDSGLANEFDSLDRARRRAASEADAETRLAELKRRMGL